MATKSNFHRYCWSEIRAPMGKKLGANLIYLWRQNISSLKVEIFRDKRFLHYRCCFEQCTSPKVTNSDGKISLLKNNHIKLVFLVTKLFLLLKVINSDEHKLSLKILCIKTNGFRQWNQNSSLKVSNSDEINFVAKEEYLKIKYTKKKKNIYIYTHFIMLLIPPVIKNCLNYNFTLLNSSIHNSLSIAWVIIQNTIFTSTFVICATIIFTNLNKLTFQIRIWINKNQI